MLMDDANSQNQLLLQAFSNSPTRWMIDTEVGDGYEDLIGGQPLLHYLRFDAKLDQNGLEELGLKHLAKKAKVLSDMSRAKNRHDLAAIGEAAAARQIASEDQLFEQQIPSRFDTVIA